MIQSSPYIEVGVLFADEIRFRLNGGYCADGGTICEGEYCVSRKGGKYWLRHAGNCREVTLPLAFRPVDYAVGDFELTDVVIGIQFHWERKENQRFKGELKIMDEGKHLTAINRLPLEDYLLSVISSEMKATASLEFLKAHAVISRSWLLAQQEKSRRLTGQYCSCRSTDREYIRWYDREDHAHFDVCADDHCQRYQGISKAYTPVVTQAVRSTCGEVIAYHGEICDARFSKCCGGVTERFENTWEPVVHPYLDKVTDSEVPFETGDLSDEATARAWILDSPQVFCNTSDVRILGEVLNDYDLETQHFFRWQVSYSAAELSALVKEKLGMDFGTVTEIVPLERGVSGRLIRVRITGTRKTLEIGKELLIRKAFSLTHLYSSAFVVDKEGERFVFHGAGWGHGVGLCQIGAAVMGARGYSYRRILEHYFRGSEILKLYAE